MKFIELLGSRKAVLTALGAAFITFAEQMHWISHDQGQTLAGLLATLVLAIAHEDASQKTVPPQTPEVKP